MKKLLACVSLLLVMSLIFSIAAFGVEPELRSGKINLISYNIHGLPFVSGAVGVQAANTKKIASLMSDGDYNLACVQEDFFYHVFFDPNMDFAYRSTTSGIPPFGDGLNVYSDYPLYSIGRVRWKNAAGVYDGGSDQLTPKGFSYCTAEVDDGVFIDIYNLHADAYSEPMSTAARCLNFMQLAAFINEYSKDRAVIVTGDTNARLSTAADKLYELLLAPCGLKDAWAQLKNGGDYHNIDPYPAEFGYAYWGIWDSVDRVMYRSGGGVSIEALTHEYIFYTNDETGESLSDHAAVEVTLEWAVTGELLEYNNLVLGEEISLKDDILRKISIFFEIFFLALSGLPQLISSLPQK